MDAIKLIQQEQLKKEIPDFKPGDTLKAYIKVIEGTRERLQPFEGICIERRNSGINESITIRRIAHGVGVERTLLLHSPRLEKLEVVKRGHVRRSRLYYLREKVGKSARVKEKKLEEISR